MHGLKASLNWTKEELTLYQTKLGKLLFGSLRLWPYWRTLVLLLPGGMRGAGRTELAPWPASGACSVRTPRPGCLPASQHRTPFTAGGSCSMRTQTAPSSQNPARRLSLFFVIPPRWPAPVFNSASWAAEPLGENAGCASESPAPADELFVFSYKRSVQKGYIRLRSPPWELSQLQLERFLKLFRVQEKGLEFPDGPACIGAISG